MGRPINGTPHRFSPYKRRSPLGVISKKVNSVFMAIGAGLRRSFTKVLPNMGDKHGLASMPVEICFRFFDFSSAEDLVSFASVDHHHLEKMRAYLKTQSFAKRLQHIIVTTIPQSPHVFSPFAFAQLIRICHLSQGRRDQCCANFLAELFIKVGSNNNVQHNFDYWGKVISAVTRDWSQAEFFNFMQMFVEATELKALIDRLMAKTESNNKEELAIRRLLRPLFLDNFNFPSPNICGPAHQLHFRLSTVLHIFASSSDAHVLMLLLGSPINLTSPTQLETKQEEFIDYNRIVTEPIHDEPNARTFLGELPFLVGQLLQTRSIDVAELRWTELEIFNFLEMLTTHPEPWVLRNFASLLVMTPGLARVAVYIRALHGDPAESGSTLFSCIEANNLLGSKANLHDVIEGVTNKCSIPTSLVVLREAIYTSHLLTMETMGTNENANNNNGVPINVDAIDYDNLKNIIEVNKKISELFLAHFNQLVPL